ncbi:hypothetical protein CTAYLR_006629 [Chrysophaeum taylorii]|uniref:CDP-diacylglycerol--inositol 3-phosphatidyltransferase n=1 Tax=Chrysophaeum taylorii TaxID=2483200 RepID=A0AAD7UK51_9STRA|nr:hypothetical protein CTAYLR_006629 [Chrysophaeum taylorii]
MGRNGAEIFLYVPNLIGYARVVLLGAFYLLALEHWVSAVTCYLASFAGDLFDGYFAKKLQQRSTLGMVLDMVTDRVATAGFLSILGILYPHRAPIFISLQGLDLASHWYHMYSTASAGGHHKSDETLHKRNFVLRVYYASYPLFAYLCVSAELAYVALYVLYFWPTAAFAGVTLEAVYLVALLPGCIVKQIVNLAQLASAANALVLRDVATPVKST